MTLVTTTPRFSAARCLIYACTFLLLPIAQAPAESADDTDHASGPQCAAESVSFVLIAGSVSGFRPCR
jgi:hypothetical protein